MDLQSQQLRLSAIIAPLPAAILSLIALTVVGTTEARTVSGYLALDALLLIAAAMVSMVVWLRSGRRFTWIRGWMATLSVLAAIAILTTTTVTLANA